MGAVHVSSRQSDDGAVVTVIGEMDLVGKSLLCAHVSEALAAGAQRVVLDLGGVSFVDAQGLSALVASKAHTDRLHRVLLLAQVPAVLWRLLRITGLHTNFTLVANPPEATGLLRPSPAATTDVAGSSHRRAASVPD